MRVPFAPHPLQHLLFLVRLEIGATTTTENRREGHQKKLRIELPYDPAIPLLVIYLKNGKRLIQKDIHTLLILLLKITDIAALFIMTELWKIPKCTWMDEQIKMWDLHTYIYIYIYTYIYITYHDLCIIYLYLYVCLYTCTQ